MHTPICNRRVVALRLCQVSLCLGFLLSVGRAEPAEPQYEGKPATYWIKAYTVGMTDEELIRSGGVQKWDADSLRKEQATREKAITALKAMGPAAVPYVVSWIKSADALANRFRKPGAETRPELKKPLPSWVSAHDVEWRSLEALRIVGQGTREALPVMMEALSTTNVFLTMMACEALGSLEAEGEPALAVLAVKLSDESPVVRASAASAIRGIIRLCPTKGEQKVVMQQLILALKDSSKSVRWNAASALGSFGEQGEDAVPALMESLKGGNAMAASALRQIGPAAKAAVPLLQEAVAGKDGDLKNRSMEALKRIEREIPLRGQPKIYDETADGSKQITDALAISKRERKHVLLQFGGNWCVWCIRLHKLFETDRGIAEKLKSDYVVVLIDVTNEHNKDVDARYGNPTQFGAPALVVLDADGKQLTTQDTGKLEAGDRHDPEKVKAFLKEWSPKK